MITYSSQSGNTEKIAKAIKDGLHNQDIELKTINETNPNGFINYNLVFLGSGVYASREYTSVFNLMKRISRFPPFYLFLYPR
ncbi:MAG: flavodoxin family protein [Candidatus Thorarchaeota archaeon]